MATSLVSLLFSHSHHLLQVANCDALLDVLAFSGQEALSTPFCYRIEFTSTDQGITREQMLMKSGSLTLQAPLVPGAAGSIQQPVRVIQGIVSGFERLNTSRDETHYALTLQPRLALLARSHQNAIYQDLSVPQIVEKILRERHHLHGQDFLFSLTRNYPRREQVMQYGEDDLHFISRLLGEVGIWFRFTTDTRLHIDVVEFYDSRQGYATGLSLPSVPPSGQHDQGVESVWGMSSRYQVVQQQVSTRDYNYREATQEMEIQVDIAPGDSTTYGDAYHYADNYLTAGSVYEADPAAESGAFYARLRHERYLNGQSRLAGVTNCATLSPGQVMQVSGGAEVTEAFARGVVVTEIDSSAQRDKSFTIQFSGIPDNHDCAFRPEPGARPVMAGTLPARVTSTTENDTYGHIDKAGRYRVYMLFDRADWETGFESLWVRQSRPYAGDTYGLHLPLLAGTEVAIGFEDGHPDRPYIAGVLHDSAHPDHVTIRNYKRNVLRTPANNKIRLDDTRGQEHIKVSTEYGGKSQLNLGHLVNGERQQRGEGFELRTDAWGAIRAAKGLFISADGQQQARGLQREMQPAVGLLKGALNQITEWGGISQAHYNVQPDAETLRGLVNNSVDLKGATLVMSAPQGLAAVTPEATLLHSGGGLYLQSLGEVNITTAQRHSVNASMAISLLSQQEGMRLVSAQGPLELESHADSLALTALQDVTIRSTKGHLQLTAKNGITIGCGGAYIRLTPQGEIEVHGPGLLSLKGQHNLQGPASQDFPLPDLPSSVCEECLKLALAMGKGLAPREES